MKMNEILSNWGMTARRAVSCFLLVISSVLVISYLITQHIGIFGISSLVVSYWILLINEGFQVALLRTEKATPNELVSAGPRAESAWKAVYGGGEGNQMSKLFIGQSFMVVACKTFRTCS
jgi:hypothetical protein